MLSIRYHWHFEILKRKIKYVIIQFTYVDSHLTVG